MGGGGHESVSGSERLAWKDHRGQGRGCYEMRLRLEK